MEDLRIKKLTEDDIDEYMAEEKKVRDNMENPIWLGDFTKDDYIFLIKNNIMDIYLWYNSKDCIGGASLIKLTDEDKKEYLSEDLDSSQMIDFGPIWVNPNYVGRGYQLMFMEFLENTAKEDYKYCVTTVAPENTYSTSNFEKFGFQNLGEVTLKRGKRSVYRKNIKK